MRKSSIIMAALILAGATVNGCKETWNFSGTGFKTGEKNSP